MPRGVMTVEQILTALAEGPPRIAENTVGLTRAQLHAAPAPGEWSANEVLAHLRSCADVWGDCMREMLKLHGVGPRSLPTLRGALSATGMAFAESARKR